MKQKVLEIKCECGRVYKIDGDKYTIIVNTSHMEKIKPSNKWIELGKGIVVTTKQV